MSISTHYFFYDKERIIQEIRYSFFEKIIINYPDLKIGIYKPARCFPHTFVKISILRSQWKEYAKALTEIREEEKHLFNEDYSIPF